MEIEKCKKALEKLGDLKRTNRELMSHSHLFSLVSNRPAWIIKSEMEEISDVLDYLTLIIKKHLDSLRQTETFEK